MSSAQFSPTPQEIKEQLERMLTATRFRAAASQTKFLTLVVNRALKGKKTPERIIGAELVRGFSKDENTDVRVTASNLRKSLRKYYSGEGREDLVIIALPDPPADKSVKLLPGEAYTPLFSYNPNHSAAKEMKLGEFYLKRGLAKDCDEAINHFAKAFKLAPNSIVAALGAAEALCQAFQVYVGVKEGERQEWLRVASDIIAKTIGMAPGFWRTRAARGYLLTCLKDFMSAEAEFNVALSLDRANTERHIGFLTFLIFVNRDSDFLQLMKKHLDSHVDEVPAYAYYGMALLNANRLDEAERVLKEALEMDRSNHALHLSLALLYGSQGRSCEATYHLECTKALVDEKSYQHVSCQFDKLLRLALR
jgi:tetratricopeptide (TPR) repeat protein